MLKPHPEIKSFLDVGCGAGELAVTLAQQGLRGTATDFSKEAIAVATNIRGERLVSPKQLALYVGGFEHVKQQKFDLVICCEVLEHVQDDIGMLHDLVKHAEKYVLISVPAKQRLFDDSDLAVGHFRRYEKQQLLDLLRDNHLKIVTFANYGYPYTNLVRIIRKGAFKKKLRSNDSSSMESKSKESGINPIKAPKLLRSLNLEPLIKALLFTSLPFNKLDLAEGYVVLCELSQ